ncbi:MAG TPA: biosynthetic peptidoglycan transglycosylase [Acidimicrobiales bacterium]|nr:biosynthetic peptidoglycan transglycosylase [Acidimicrobiales bacterium]
MLLAWIHDGAALARRLARRGGPVVAGGARAATRAVRARRPRMGELAVALRPLQHDALRSFDDVVQRGLPALGRWTAAAARLATSALVVAARATGRCGRRCRPLLRPVRRVALALAPPAAVVVIAVGLVGWYAPGPLLDAAATFTSVDATPFPPLAQRSVVTAADGTPLGVVHGGRNRRVVGLDAFPPIVRHLVVLAEDRRFFEHEGFDQAAMVRAALANSRSGAVAQGGSTITQQLVKLNLVGGERRLVRKVRELVLSVAVEHQTTKEELLSRYLNEVYFGSGAYGIAAAAETYFATTVELLRRGAPGPAGRGVPPRRRAPGAAAARPPPARAPRPAPSRRLNGSGIGSGPSRVPIRYQSGRPGDGGGEVSPYRTGVGAAHVRAGRSVDGRPRQR